MKKRYLNFFWISYADLITALFFVMLILFVLTNALLNKAKKEAEEQYKVTRKILNRILEIENSVKNIDSTYFKYDEDFKRYTLKDIDVKFSRDSFNIEGIDSETRTKLFNAGKAIKDFVNKAPENVKYQLIIEGQTSRDKYLRNDQLSYERALSLFNYWDIKELRFDSTKCEVVISGSGYRSQFRDMNNTANQRFVIHIIPMIDYEKFIKDIEADNLNMTR